MEIFDYFGSVLFNRLDSEIQDIFLRLGHLQRISKQTADRLGGERAMDVLFGLHRRNAFTYRAYTEDPVFFSIRCFGNLFRNNAARGWPRKNFGRSSPQAPLRWPGKGSTTRRPSSMACKPIRWSNPVCNLLTASSPTFQHYFAASRKR